MSAAKRLKRLEEIEMCASFFKSPLARAINRWREEAVARKADGFVSLHCRLDIVCWRSNRVSRIIECIGRAEVLTL